MKFRFDEIAFNSTLKKKPVEEDKIHYIGLEHIEPGNFSITEWGSDVAPVGEKLIMKKGDILFGKRRAYQRKVAIAPFDGIFSAHGMVLRPKTDVIDADFFPLFISSDTFMETAMRISVGGLSPTINWKDLKEQEFELPSLEEQQTIAKKAWAAYRLKEAYQRLLVATDEMVKSQFIEMFGCEANEYNNQVLYSFEDICFDNTKAATKIPASEYKYHGQYPIFDQASDTYIAGFTNTSNGLCRDFPAILFGDHSRVFKLIEQPFFIGADGVKIIRWKQNINGPFLYHMLRYTKVPNTGYNRHFKWLKLKKYPIPNKKQQEEFAAIVSQADKSKFELKRAIEAIDKVIKSLING